MISHQERTNPTAQTLDETLELLAAANEQGQLVSIAFLLSNGPQQMVDYRGTNEMTEIMCRTVNERIADDVQVNHPSIAAAIRADLRKREH